MGNYYSRGLEDISSMDIGEGIRVPPTDAVHFPILFMYLEMKKRFLRMSMSYHEAYHECSNVFEVCHVACV